MPTHRLVPIAGALLLFSACAAPGPRVDSRQFLAEIAWLADDARGGRDTGSPELLATADYVAARFEAAGLLPLGDDGSYLQHFTVKGQRRLEAGNTLSIGGRALTLQAEYMPLQTSLSGSARGPVVFAGYGISDADGGRDDYADLDVKDKVVLALRRAPRSEARGTRYADGGPGRQHSTFTSKINNAFRHGAAGLLVVNDPLHCEPDTTDDILPSYRPLRGEGVGASLPAARLTAEVGLELFASRQLDLRELQLKLDAGDATTSFVFDGMTAALEVRAELTEVTTVNVLGYLPGTDPALAGEQVLIGAHMDHLGLGLAATSRGGAATIGQIHNGADDNASGTAGVMELARVLARRKGELRRGVIFAAWSGEERGLLGSQHYTEQPALPLDQLVAVINMDMIGRSKDGYVVVEGMGTSPGFGELVRRAQQDLGLALDLRFADKPSDNSDHASFVRRNIPVINFFTGLHDDYHMPSDDTSLINAEDGARIASLAGQSAVLLANLDARPIFTEERTGAPPGPGSVAAAQDADAAASTDPHAGAGTGGPGAPGAPGDSGPVQAYRVRLGTQPDMGYQEEDGVRLSGVGKDSPAERAGLKAGDVITAFDGLPVKNLEDYSVLLFRHKPGDEVSITVRRGTSTLELKALLTGPGGDG